MDYKVIPFNPIIDRKKNASLQVAEQLEEMIMHFSNKGWEYIRLESISSIVAGQSGCFGLGEKPGYTKFTQVVVFIKSA